MVRRVFTGEEVAKVLTDMGYTPKGRKGSHLKLRYKHPETGEVRNVSVPMGGEIPEGTLRNIADQCGAKEFDSLSERRFAYAHEFRRNSRHSANG